MVQIFLVACNRLCSIHRHRQAKRRTGNTQKQTMNTTQTQYQKVMFSSKNRGKTAGLVIESEKLAGMSISDVSRFFPYSEALKMGKLHVSPKYNSWEHAFEHEF